MTYQQIIDDLRSRLARLEATQFEATQPPRRGRTNMVGAARFYGKSAEWLRRKHLLGEGPRRKRVGRYSVRGCARERARRHQVHE